MVVTSSYNAPTSHARQTVYAPGICTTMFAGSTFTFHKEYPLTLIERLRDLFALLFFLLQVSYPNILTMLKKGLV